MSTKIIMAMTAACAVLGITSRASIFDDRTGDHKLSTEGNWNGGYPTAETDAKIGPLTEGTYTSNADLTTKSLSLETASSSVPVTLAIGAHKCKVS